MFNQIKMDYSYDPGEDFTILDVSGETCPIPLLRMKQLLKIMSKGGKIKLIATDPNTKRDIQRFCQNGKSQLLEYAETDGSFLFLILKTV